jgi:protein-disulfide isomerase
LDPSLRERVVPVLRAVRDGLARGVAAAKRGVVAFDAPGRIADAREDIANLELDRRAVALARRGGAGARIAAGRARVRAKRAAEAGGPAVRSAWNRSAARIGRITRRPAPPRVASPPAPPPTPEPPRRARAVPRPLPLFDEPGRAEEVPTVQPTPAAAPAPPRANIPPLPAPSRPGMLEKTGTQLMIGLGGIGVGALAVALLGAQPKAAPAPGSAAFGEAVRAYLLEHPEVIPEAVARLQDRETGKMLAANREALQTPFSGAWAGAADGDVVVVEFTDYACGFCRASVPDVARLIAEDRRVKVVYRELPILGAGSEEAARIALSAARQNRYGDVHRALFAAGSPNAAKVAQVAAAERLDPDKIARDRADPAIRAEIDSNLRLARAVGLSGTPTFVIGDKILSARSAMPR